MNSCYSIKTPKSRMNQIANLKYLNTTPKKSTSFFPGSSFSNSRAKPEKLNQTTNNRNTSTYLNSSQKITVNNSKLMNTQRSNTFQSTKYKDKSSIIRKEISIDLASNDSKLYSSFLPKNSENYTKFSMTEIAERSKLSASADRQRRHYDVKIQQNSKNEKNYAFNRQISLPRKDSECKSFCSDFSTPSEAKNKNLRSSLFDIDKVSTKS